MIRYLFILFLVSQTLWARVSIEADVDCPVCELEKCFWEISLASVPAGRGNLLELDWRKGVQSLHTEKPFAETLKCNADRDFRTEGGGYIHVWYRGDTKPCVAEKPGDCGVEFKLLPGGTSPLGFTVRPPAHRILERFEHLSTLNLQCGDFSGGAESFARYRWDASLSWDRRSGRMSARTLRLEKN